MTRTANGSKIGGDSGDRLRLEAANDNPGGEIAIEVALQGIVQLMARAYVSQLAAEAGHHPVAANDAGSPEQRAPATDTAGNQMKEDRA
jgi:hypothetical protein